MLFIQKIFIEHQICGKSYFHHGEQIVINRVLTLIEFAKSCGRQETNRYIVDFYREVVL